MAKVVKKLDSMLGATDFQEESMGTLVLSEGQPASSSNQKF